LDRNNNYAVRRIGQPEMSPQLRRKVDVAFGLVYLCLAALFGWLFYVRYWMWRDCIREAASSCITPDGTNLIAGGALWLLPCVAFAAVAVRRIFRCWTPQRSD